MATYQSNAMLGSELGALKYGQAPISFVGSIVLPANTLLAQNDVLQLCMIPQKTMLLSILINVPDMDTGSQLTLDLKDNVASPNTYLANSTTGQAGGIIETNDLTTVCVQYATQQILQLVASTASSGAPNTAMTLIFGALFAPYRD